MGIPSKKVFISLLVGVGMVGGSWLLLGDGRVLLDGTFLGKASEAVIGLIAGESKKTYTDSDNDNLPDWEETLFGTNPNNNDSDGDRIPDGEQYVSSKNIPDIEATDSVLNYLNQVGQSASSGQQVVPPEATLVIPPDYFKKIDIKTTSNTSDAISSYVFNFLAIINDHPEGLGEKPIEIINHWLETGDERDLEKLSSISSAQKALAHDLALLDTPRGLIDTHLLFINSLYLGALALEDIDVTVHNPQAGFFAAAQYVNYQTKRARAIVEIAQYFDKYIPQAKAG